MNGFLIRTKDIQIIRFRFYVDAAPITSTAFLKALPFSRNFLHARVSGQEIWIDDAPSLNIIQENSSVFAEPGEIVIGPASTVRNKIANCIGIFYGEGRLLDGGNIFAKVVEENLDLLKTLGNMIWRNGAQDLTFEAII